MKIGDINKLTVKKESSIGLFLEDELGLEVLLPKRYVAEGTKAGDVIDAFIYRDSEDRLIATTETPIAKINELALMEVKSVTDHGAFLNWGLSKDLFVPHKEQLPKLKDGDKGLFYVYLDQLTQRIAASNKLDKFLSDQPEDLGHGDEVKIIVWKQHELGYQVVINEAYLGMVYRNQLFQPLNLGDTMIAYVNQIREDGRIDILLQKPGYAHIDDASSLVLEKLNANGGYLSLHDKSDPKTIKTQLNLSKKAFKKAVGGLFKAGKISLEEDGIRLK
ncbi:MAG: S1-like domain-containing RNA-binding protein [Salibacteraceae bacterium]